ncbi:MAG: TerB family tellurite resistance protein [Magnetococcus sp. WYHC-3]
MLTQDSGIQEELAEYWRADGTLPTLPTRVVADSEKFRLRLGIGSEAFVFLTKAENLKDYLGILTGGGVAAGGAMLGWMATLGVMGRLGLALGVVSTPMGWIALAGASGAAAVYGFRKIRDMARKSAVTELPNFINTPLDALGGSLMAIMGPIAMKLAHADGTCVEEERQVMHRFFVGHWGFDETYVHATLADIESRLEWYGFQTLAENLRQLQGTRDLDYDKVADDILRLAEGVCHADGVLHAGEKKELEALRAALDQQRG